MLSTIAACGTLKKEIGLRRDSEAFLLSPVSIITHFHQFHQLMELLEQLGMTIVSEPFLVLLGLVSIVVLNVISGLIADKLRPFFPFSSVAQTSRHRMNQFVNQGIAKRPFRVLQSKT